MSQLRESRRMELVGALLVALGSSACAGSKDTAAVVEPQPEAESADASTSDASTSTAFENPGGMWMPGQMAGHAQTLEKLGVEYDPAALTDPTSFPLGAVVSLGGCSASFVSPDGLIITNHHCVVGALQYNSTPEKNLLQDGFLAKERSQEPSAGPTQRVYVTTSITDVSSEVLDGLDTIEDDRARFEEMNSRVEKLEAKCNEKPDTYCRVASYFEGAEFHQIEALEIRDVRLVHAPAAGVGVFGGEVDNWRWPRHTGDYSFLRAYVGPDGKPADYSKDNVPFEPPHHLKVATEDLDPGDFVMVAGYPGRTYRLKTADEVADAVQWTYPRQIELVNDYIGLIESMTAGRPELAIKAASRLRGLHNARTNFKGMLDGLVKDGLAERRAQMERELQAWIETDPKRLAKYGTVLQEIADLQAEAREHRAHDAEFGSVVRASSLLGVATTLHEIAESRTSDDATKRQNMERMVPRIGQGWTAMTRSYDQDLEIATLALAISRAAKLPEDERPTALLEALIGKTDPSDDAAVKAALSKLYAKTRLDEPGVRAKLLETATPKSLKKNRDPFIQVAAAIQEASKEIETRSETLAGKMAVLRPRYIEALRAFHDGPVAPDANSTLRITYGTIRGYRPTPKADVYEPFTMLSQMVAKHTGEEPFVAPPDVLAAAEDAADSRWVDEDLGEVPVNFLADLDITGGNSGSATLNARGELIGLVFDGNYEAMASDWVFIPEVTRSIHVDIRYVLWNMDEVDGAQHLLEEMGIAPRAQ